MYHQIELKPEEWHLQAVLFRFSENEPVQKFVIPVLTYGLAPAQYLSLKVLAQLVKDEGRRFPDAVEVIHRHRYVDDFLFGEDPPEELQRLRDQVVGLLATGGFELAK